MKLDNKQLTSDFHAVIKVLKSIKTFEQYISAMKYSRLFFAKWKQELNKTNSFVDLYRQVLLTSKTVLRNLPTNKSI